ncbi:MAG: AMP-binding protein [Bryobacterales bacterium]|nr:AMP-binding protein [Bryobacterales bacterium]
MGSNGQQRGDIEAAVLETVRALLRELGSSEAAQRATPKSSLDRDLGLGSLERVELLVRLEGSLGLRLPETGAQTAESPADWVRIALEANVGSPSRGRWPIIQPSREAYPAPAGAATVAEVLRIQAERDPARIHVHLLDQDRGQDISHGQLYASASAIAAGLAASGLRRGETVAIMLPTCEDFFASFLGVMLAGGIAVPVYPPARPNQLEAYIQRQIRILKNAQVRFLISFERVRAVASVLGGQLPSLQETFSADALAVRGRGSKAPDVEPAEICFIQYTSGSTGDPKGVTLTHANVLANIRGIGFAVEVRPTDAVVSWLPLYHDMGLIGSWLFSLYYGLPITVLSPLDFLVRPERWLWALSDSAGSLCPAPNFAFELCVRKVTDQAMEGVDLSPWRVAINAGEPVLPATLRRFTERFRPWGFDERSLMPFYGLAESSVALTYPPFWRGPVVDTIDRAAYETEGRAVPTSASGSRSVLEFVSNGRPLPEHEVRVVADNGAILPDRTRGRVLFRGPSRTNGYFRNMEATAEVLDDDGWIDSGDLGYVVEDELYVTGRLKDCIIKGGRNIIPQDVEMASWEADGVRKGCVAAFGCIDPGSGTEKLVVVAETRVSDPAARQRIQTAVTDAVAHSVGIPPDDVVLVVAGTVPKTSSGKIQRSAIRSAYESGNLAARSAKPTWVQLAKVGIRAGLRSAAETVGRGSGTMLGSVRRLFGWSVAALFGMLARLAPSPGMARRAIAPAAAILSALRGARCRKRIGASGATGLMLVNRLDGCDALVVAAALRDSFVFADRTAFGGLSSAEAFLLDPLVAPPVAGVSAQRAADLQLRMQAAIAGGQSVVSFADSAAGASPARTRFRAEGFAAAAATGAPLIPVHLGRVGTRAVAATQGEAIQISTSDHELATVRAQVREVLAQTSRPTPG